MAIQLCARRLALSGNSILKIPKRSGYYVLIPELREDLQKIKYKKNIEFKNLTAEKCVQSVSSQCAQFEDLVNSLETFADANKDIDVFNEVLYPIEEKLVSLEITWCIAKVLAFANQSLMTLDKYTSIHERASAAAAHRYVSIPIFEACKRLLNDQNADLSDEQRRVLQKFVLEGKLHGLEFQEKLRNAFRLSWNTGVCKKAEFTYKVKESTKLLSPVLQDYNNVRFLPENLIKAMAKDPNKPTEGPWVVKLDSFIERSFLENCPDRSLRSKVWENNVTRGALHQETLLRTSVTLEEIRHREQLRAKTLGYKSYAELSLETKMVDSLKTIYDTFDVLLEAARPAQEREIKELTEFANTRGQNDILHEYDIPYWSKKYRKTVYEYKDDEVKAYFPLPKVLSGLFGLVESLYNIKITKTENPEVWDQDVQFFNVFDLKKSSTVPVGSFYFDPYVRTGSNPKEESNEDHGWMMPLRGKSAIAGTTPISALIFNFPRPTAEIPSLLSYSAVNTLFEKFGRLLQHVLTMVEHNELAGTSNIEWDAAFVSDYFMANWLHIPAVLQQISGHYDTGEPLTPELIETINKVRSQLAGYKLCKEMYYSHMDLEIYSTNTFWTNIMQRLWKKYLVTPLHPENSHVCSWSEIFTDNWGAAYYSRLWSKMLAADMFSAVHEISMENEEEVKELTQRYRETFLAFGGTYSANEVFRRFRGRDPSPQPLITHLNLMSNEMELKRIGGSACR